MSTIVKKSKIAGKGLFASKEFKKGNVVGFFKGKETTKEHIHVLWTHNEKGILITNKLKYANHNWINPNSKIVKCKNEYKLKALRKIKDGEEITWDYSVGFAYDKLMKKDNPLYDYNGYSVIQWNIFNGDYDSFKKNLVFLENNNIKNIEFKVNEENLFIFEYLCAFGTVQMLKYYMKRNEINKSNLFNFLFNNINIWDNDRFFRLACEHNNTEVINFLLDFEDIEDAMLIKYKGMYPLFYFLENVKDSLTDKEFDLVEKWIRLSNKIDLFSILNLTDENGSTYHIYDYLLDYNYLNDFFKLDLSNKKRILYALRTKSPKKIYKILEKIDYSKINMKDILKIKEIHRLSDNSKYLHKIIQNKYEIAA